MTAPQLYRHATRSQIIETAAAEGHDADIPSSAGSIRPVVSRASTRQPRKADEKNGFCKDLEKDLEKGDDKVSFSSADEPEATEMDPNIVDFDGPNDPENPLNWNYNKKWGMVSLVSALTFLTPLASSMFAPGVPQIMKEFNSTNDMLAGFMISVYVLGVSSPKLLGNDVLIPSVCLWTSQSVMREVHDMIKTDMLLVIAPLSEMYGRLPLYHSCNFLFVVFTIAAAVASNMGQFITFRFFMGCQYL